MSNDPGSIPMADPLTYFLTWTTYGSWLPGDERGWTEKPGRMCEPDANRQKVARQMMTEEELTLRVEQREMVEITVADHCRIRGWHLHIVRCLTQHVHVVVTAPNRDPEDVMDQFKAWCTRRLKEQAAAALKPEAQAKGLDAQAKGLDAQAKGLDAQAKGHEDKTFAGASGFKRVKVRQNWWTQRGSKRRLYDEASLEAAIRYVLEGQGGPRSCGPEQSTK